MNSIFLHMAHNQYVFTHLATMKFHMWKKTLLLRSHKRHDRFVTAQRLQ